jgi:hypothetical protein
MGERMRSIVNKPDAERSPTWLEATEVLLGENHVGAWSRNIALRERFALDLARGLHAIPDTSLVIIAGATVHTLDGFCKQLERALPSSSGKRLKRSIDGPGGIVERLNERPGDLADHTKRRYYLWREADVLLRHDRALFGELVDALAGVAAESEYASEDLLLIHRAIFVGGPSLEVYGRDPKGQFRTWLNKRGHERRGEALWKAISGVEVPPVKVFEIKG